MPDTTDQLRRVERPGRLLPTVLITGVITTALNLVVMVIVRRPPADTRSPNLMFTDANGHEQHRVEVTESSDETVLLTLVAHNGDRARVALRPTGRGSLRVSVADGKTNAAATSYGVDRAADDTPDTTGTRAPSTAPEQSPVQMVVVPSDTGGTIRGAVHLIGQAPRMEDLRRSADPFCAKTPMKDEEVIENPNHTLKNVLVHVNGAPAAPPPRGAATITQDSCMYRPRVQGVVAGQTLSIKNGDRTLHNVHTYRGATTIFNQAQVPGAANIDKQFSGDGALLKFKCDVHQWMTGFVWVQNNAYFAVTGDDGTFEIKNVPPGRYEIEAWHERLGSRKQLVQVASKGSAVVTFELAQ